MWRILERHGVTPMPAKQFRIRLEGRLHFVDDAWAEVRHGIEYDGGGGHNTVTDRHEDRARWTRFRRADWEVLHVTERTPEREIADFGHMAASLACAATA